MTLLRITAATTLIATLAACGGGALEIRDGPQAVHPSGSALASGAYVEAAPVAQAPCGHHGHHCHSAGHGHHKSHYAGHGNDGSTPIID